jgi:hypothetical protein
MSFEGEEWPEPPVNVRIVYLDGAEAAVDLVYDGRDEEGTHVWVATPMQPLLSRYATVRCDRLPPHTAISLRLPTL